MVFLWFSRKISTRLPYDCGAGMANWQLGWSDASLGGCAAVVWVSIIQWGYNGWFIMEHPMKIYENGWFMWVYFRKPAFGVRKWSAANLPMHLGWFRRPCHFQANPFGHNILQDSAVLTTVQRWEHVLSYNDFWEIVFCWAEKFGFSVDMRGRGGRNSLNMEGSCSISVVNMGKPWVKHG